MTIGERIRKYRKDRKLTQKSLGEQCIPPINEVQIRQYELGKAKPKIETLEKIARALEVPVTELLFDEGQYFKIETDVPIDELVRNNSTQLDNAINNEISNMGIDLTEDEKNEWTQAMKETLANSIDVNGKLYSSQGNPFAELALVLKQSFGDDAAEIVIRLTLLNAQGLKKLIEIIDDLIEIPKYSNLFADRQEE